MGQICRFLPLGLRNLAKREEREREGGERQAEGGPEASDSLFQMEQG